MEQWWWEGWPASSKAQDLLWRLAQAQRSIRISLKNKEWYWFLL
jgi:hypothetical protein